MGDIVERLRLLVPSDSSGAAFDAVNEITRLRNELHITQEWSARVIAGHEQDMTEITALRAEVEQHQRSFDLRWDTSMRAIARWQEANPGNDLNWPDHADLVVWLLERDAALRAENERLRAALRNCIGLLDGLVAESGRSIEWGEEDPFRMGEWFEVEDLEQIKEARAALEGKP